MLLKLNQTVEAMYEGHAVPRVPRIAPLYVSRRWQRIVAPSYTGVPLITKLLPVLKFEWQREGEGGAIARGEFYLSTFRILRAVKPRDSISFIDERCWGDGSMMGFHLNSAEVFRDSGNNYLYVLKM